jgi:hypothetical protein
VAVAVILDWDIVDPPYHAIVPGDRLIIEPSISCDRERFNNDRLIKLAA